MGQRREPDVIHGLADVVNGQDAPTPVDMASSLPAAIALGITVVDIYAACMQRLGPQADPRLALELVRLALGSQLVGTLLTKKE
jgi:hypothetical protein